MTTIEPTVLRPIPEFEGVHQIWPRGDRLAHGGLNYGTIVPVNRAGA